jgi:hypothetical protein
MREDNRKKLCISGGARNRFFLDIMRDILGHGNLLTI